jgi:hypothetical protein
MPMTTSGDLNLSSRKMTNDKNPLQDILPEMLGAAWQQPNQSANDFRSKFSPVMMRTKLMFLGDTVTTPTLQILRAIALASFNDGWTGGGDTKAFEDYTSQLLGMQSTIFMVSTTLANQVAIWAHIGTAPAGVICDCTWKEEVLRCYLALFHSRSHHQMVFTLP